MTGHRWTEEELADRGRFLEGAAFAALLLAAGACFGFGVWVLLARGSFAGWLCICMAAVFAIGALCVGEELDR